MGWSQLTRPGSATQEARSISAQNGWADLSPTHFYLFFWGRAGPGPEI